ncbi:hypothetical protein DEO72_LG7g935 [Vigna unguiculata]|uniref:Uncharacterized protein n=1 Tax=Vigna unguiculata TaxID=3917 RepID=A0A4D6MDZ0_VIGUN|nr:hypothetical protein DEO72_LG7g933 [Vigna unguiculata]QCD99651.1 hypothetical protein DEO72_LG7g935 [Vigna unguiculata]
MTVWYEPPGGGYKSREAQNVWRLAAMRVLPSDTCRQGELEALGVWRYASPTWRSGSGSAWRYVSPAR